MGDDMSHAYPVSTPTEIRRYINAALAHPGHTEIPPFAEGGDAQVILDEIWKVLDSPALPDATKVPSFGAYRNQLRRLSLKIATQFDKFPTLLILEGVQCTDNQQQSAGGFADVFLGIYRGNRVGLKRLRIYLMMTSARKEVLKKAFYRESLLWKNLIHDHILPFIGVSEDVFPGSVCMVIPWMANGNLRHYIEEQVAAGNLTGPLFEASIIKWLQQTAEGLAYLHGEGVVHGDLHAGNILVDRNGSVRLTDFGMSLIAEGTAYNYGSQHGGGAIRWSAPELFDPEEFGLESSRPTFDSDMYAFACIAIELYTGNPPFADLTDRQVPLRVVRGDRPPRPILPNASAISSTAWSVIQSCWNQTITSRPSADVVANKLARAGTSHLNRLEQYLKDLRSYMSVNTKRGREARWLQDALRRTETFYTNDGVVDSLTWMLVPENCEDVFVPEEAVSIQTSSDLKWLVARYWSTTHGSLLPSMIPFILRSSSQSDIDSFEILQKARTGVFEILIASPKRIQWLSVTGAFSPQTLDRRLVDVSDGRKASTVTEEFAPWVIRLRPEIILDTYFTLRCIIRRASPETSVFEAYDADSGLAIPKYDILCHAD